MLSIIILNYNQKNLLKVCLRGILKVKPKLEYEIIIVDNNSKKSDQEEIKKLVSLAADKIKIIVNQKNLGFAAGCNLGIKKAKGDYLLILNPDIAVLGGSIEKMVNWMKSNKNIGIIGPKLLNPDRSVQKSCYHYPSWDVPILRRTILGKLKWAKKKIDEYIMADFNHQEIKSVDWILGAALLLRKEMLKKVGLFDQRFFLYFEDVDLCRRANLAGWQVVYYPLAEMFHYHQRDSARPGIFSLFSRFTRIHIASAIKYFLKWRKT